MTEEDIQKAEKVGTGYAEGMFKAFTKPGTQGNKFTWEGFPDMVAAIARASLFEMFSNEEWASLDREYKRDLEDITGKAAIKRANELIVPHTGT